ncbi:hypothetical protein ACFE04_016155 [Oxalis oulophora]
MESFFVFFLLMMSFNGIVYGNAELKALMELKVSLDPTNKHLQSWRSDGDPCSGSFEGVACNEHGKVANISLQSKGLNGTLSAAVGELKCLSGLYLHYNSLTGQIPKDIGNLTELSDLYLDVNNFSGSIPPEVGNMTNLQVLQLCCNQLTGNIPTQLGSLKKLSVLALQYNQLSGPIPSSLADLGMLRRLDISFNRFSGIIPTTLGDSPQLQVLDVRNNSLMGVVPSGLKKLGDGFQSEKNPGLCGVGFPKVRACTSFDNVNINQINPMGPSTSNDTFSKIVPQAADNLQPHCSHSDCSNSPNLPKIIVISGVIAVTILLAGTGLLTIFRYRRKKQRIGNASENSDRRFSTDQAEEISRSISNASPHLNLEYSNRFSGEFLNSFKFNFKEIESATQYFSQVNLLGKSSFSSVYKGVLRDGSVIAIRSINATSCQTEEAEFVKGLNLLSSLRHENLVKLRGFCCSKSRNECYLVYDFAPRGALLKYLDIECRNGQVVLDWPSRVRIINGIAKGIHYLHSSDANKPAIIHRNISVEKILIDQQFNPLIADSGLHKVLADDFVFSALKISAAMGYMAPEYVTTGGFTEKTDIFAFGVVILQVLSGKCMISNSTRIAAEAGRPADFIDPNLLGEYSESEASKLGILGLACTKEQPHDRPTIEEVIRELINENDKTKRSSTDKELLVLKDINSLRYFRYNRMAPYSSSRLITFSPSSLVKKAKYRA